MKISWTNCFVYPYAEVDGRPHDASFVILMKAGFQHRICRFGFFIFRGEDGRIKGKTASFRDGAP